MKIESQTPTQPSPGSRWKKTDGRSVKGNREAKVLRYTRPDMYPKQEAAIFDEARYSLIEATTKAGKTAACAIWIVEKALRGRRGHQFWWVAPIFAQAKIVYRRITEALNPASFKKNESELTITFVATNTTIHFKGADKPDSLYGDDVYAAVIDEASRVKEESWYAVRSTLTATQGAVRIIGNVKGRRNWFFKMARRAEAGEKHMAYHKITWKDAVEAGVLKAEEIEDARRQLPPSVFKQLYEAEPADDEGNPFGIAAIKALVVETPSALPIVCWGWDFAKSFDWTVGIALDRNGDVVRMVRFQAPWGETKERVKRECAGRPAMGDSTGVGDPIVEDLQRMSVDFEAFVFTSRSKQQLMEGLAADIQQGHGKFPAGILQDELEAFEYEYTASGVRYSSPEGMHDDCVCAYALARMMHRRGHGAPFVSSRLNGQNAETGERDREVRDVWKRRDSVLLID